jgi:type I restriction enzyme R subunit
VKDIEGFVKQVITDPKESYQILEAAIMLMQDLRQRANFEVYLKQFMQSMDIILPRVEAHPYLIPVKRFGYIMHRVKERYKDDSLTISSAGEKVQKIIDEHLVSLGIDPKIPPVELMSDQFIQKLDENRSPKSKASEMEHAIRKHSKVYFDEDPSFYAKISEKLEAVIQKHKQNWDELCAALFKLRSDVQDGRKDEIEGVDAKAAPFYDLMGRIAFGDTGFPPDHVDAAKQLVADVMAELEKTIDIINFWSNMPEVSKLRGRLTDMLYLLNIDEVSDNADQIVTDITALAKRRHEDIVG